MKFKIGDIVTGTKDNNYTYTNSDMIGKVVYVNSDNTIDVEFLESKNLNHDYLTGKVFHGLLARRFEKENKDEYKVEVEYDESLEGTFVTIGEKYTFFVELEPDKIGICDSESLDEMDEADLLKAVSLYKKQKGSVI